MRTPSTAPGHSQTATWVAGRIRTSTLPEVFDLDAKARRLAQAAQQGRLFYGKSGPFDSGASLATPFWVGYPPLRGMRFRSTSEYPLPKLPAPNAVNGCHRTPIDRMNLFIGTKQGEFL